MSETHPAAGFTLQNRSKSPYYAGLKPAELLAVADFSRFSWHFSTHKLPGENPRSLNVCVCGVFYIFISLSEKYEKYAKPRSLAGLRSAGFLFVTQKTLHAMQRVTP